MTKKKVGVYSNSSLARSGFGKHARILLQWLNANGYDAFEMAGGYEKGKPELSGLPWRAYGLSINDPNLNNNESWRQLNAYGVFGLEEIIEKEKPDITIAIEDSWAWYGLQDKAIFRENPENWIFWSPIDSEPLLQTQIDFAKQARHFAVKAPFAQKALKKEGIDAEFWGALSDFDKFFPAREEGLKLRQKSGIDDNTLIFGFVFRNQLRKLVTPLIHGFKLFKDKNPAVKAKLVFHTDPFETWKIPRIQRLAGLEPEDIYFTTICPACKEVTLGPAIEENTKKICKSCGRGELHHAKPQAGVSEKDLNSIYNTFDGYLHPASSGGNEFPLGENAHIGTMAATCDYAFGTMYVESGFVHSLPFGWYDEFTSGYKKSSPTAEGICEFMEKVKNIDPEEKKEFEIKTREWALDFFNTEKILKKVAAVIDSIPAPNYNYSFPNENPPMSTAENNEDWIRETHYAFFGTLQPSEQDFNFLKDVLSKGATRESVYKQSQDIVRARKNQFDPSKYFKEDGKKRILICLQKSIGDCLTLLSVLEAVKEKYKDWNIFLMTDDNNKNIFEHLDYISGIIPSYRVDDTFFWEGNSNNPKLVDIYIQSYILTQRFNAWTHNGNSLN